MIKTGIKETRKRLSEYINMVQKGEEIIITRRDEPVAKLVSIGKTRLKNLKTPKGYVAPSDQKESHSQK